MCVCEKKCEELLHILMTPVGECLKYSQTALECHFCLTGHSVILSAAFSLHMIFKVELFTPQAQLCKNPRKVDKSLQAWCEGCVKRLANAILSIYWGIH